MVDEGHVQVTSKMCIRACEERGGKNWEAFTFQGQGIHPSTQGTTRVGSHQNMGEVGIQGRGHFEITGKYVSAS